MLTYHYQGNKVITQEFQFTLMAHRGDYEIWHQPRCYLLVQRLTLEIPYEGKIIQVYPFPQNYQIVYNEMMRLFNGQN